MVLAPVCNLNTLLEQIYAHALYVIKLRSIFNN